MSRPLPPARSPSRSAISGTTGFAIPSTNLETKGDNITFSTPTIEGTVLRRNKADGNGNHPWKAEVTEGDDGVSAATISGWYSTVYEPAFTDGGE